MSLIIILAISVKTAAISVLKLCFVFFQHLQSTQMHSVLIKYEYFDHEYKYEYEYMVHNLHEYKKFKLYVLKYTSTQ